jgi:hypothetical protein
MSVKIEYDFRSVFDAEIKPEVKDNKPYYIEIFNSVANDFCTEIFKSIAKAALEDKAKLIPKFTVICYEYATFPEKILNIVTEDFLNRFKIAVTFNKTSQPDTYCLGKYRNYPSDVLSIKEWITFHSYSAAYTYKNPYLFKSIPSPSSYTADKHLAKLFEGAVKRKFTDFEIVVEGNSFYADIAILARCSRYFSAQPNFKEGREGRLTLQDEKASVFKAFIHLIYMASLPSELSFKECFSLFLLCNKWEVDNDLRDIVKQETSRKIAVDGMSEENFKDLLDNALFARDFEEYQVEVKKLMVDLAAFANMSSKCRDIYISFIDKNTCEYLFSFAAEKNQNLLACMAKHMADCMG